MIYTNSQVKVKTKIDDLEFNIIYKIQQQLLFYLNLKKINFFKLIILEINCIFTVFKADTG